MEVITGSITIQTILLAHDNWIIFSSIYGSQIREVVYDNIHKILSCRKSLGYSIYTCTKCGKAAQDKWLSKTLSELLPVQYQHLVFTLPFQLRLLFLTHRKLMMDIFFKAASLSVLNFEYKDHATNSNKTLTLHALAFIARFIRHIPEKYFHQMRYYGIFANRIKNMC